MLSWIFAVLKLHPIVSVEYSVYRNLVYIRITNKSNVVINKPMILLRSIEKKDDNQVDFVRLDDYDHRVFRTTERIIPGEVLEMSVILKSDWITVIATQVRFDPGRLYKMLFKRRNWSQIKIKLVRGGVSEETDL